MPPLLLVLFFLSGASALVLQTVFVRQCTWLLGSAVTATSIVLAAFLGGLSLGAAVLGPVADRARRPLRLYAFLEIATAIAASLAVAALGTGRDAIFGAARAAGNGPLQDAVLYATALLLLLAATVPMGGTLPALTRHFVRGPERVLAPLGVLYGINTAGGAAGALVGGVVLFESLGVSASGFAAAAVAGAVGALVLALDRAGRWSAMGDPTASPARGAKLRAGHDAAASDSGMSAALRTACIAVAASGGFCALGYEVLWTRLLTLPLRSYAYSFSVMLSLFLAGLVIGALALAAIAPRIRRPARALAAIQIAMGLYVAASVLWMPALLVPPEEAASFGLFLARAAAKAALIVIPPTVLSGMALPLAARAFASSAERIGADVGRVYAANTLGAIGGAVFSGLVLLPLVGAPRALAALAAVGAFAGAALAWADAASPVRRLGALALGGACLLPLAFPSERYRDAFFRASRGRETLGEVLFFREGATDTVAVARRGYGFRDPDAKSVLTNGIAMTATVLPVWRYMAAEGHLPALLARDPSRALVVCVGTGITLGAVASHPAVRSIDAVDLSEGILAALPLFDRENERAYADPRVRVLRQDGRHFLERNPGRYGFITLEPPPPIVSGSVHLYTRDFYELCRRRLEPGGVIAQWLPLHSQSLTSARMAAATFVEAFPHVQLWLPSLRDAVLIGSDVPVDLSFERLRRAYAEPATRRNLRAAALETPEALLATFFLDRDGVRAWSGGAPILTDEHPRMEFFRSLGPNMTDREIGTLLDVPRGGPGWVDGLDADPAFPAAVETERRALLGYVRSEVDDRPGSGVEAARLSRGTRLFRYRLGCADDQLAFLERGAGRGAEWASQAARCRQLLDGQE